MIVLIVNKEYNEDTNKFEMMVSHGVDIETGETVVTGNVPLIHFGEAKYDNVLGEYVIE